MIQVEPLWPWKVCVQICSQFHVVLFLKEHLLVPTNHFEFVSCAVHWLSVSKACTCLYWIIYTEK